MNYPTVLYKSYPNDCREVANQAEYQQATAAGYRPLNALSEPAPEPPKDAPVEVAAAPEPPKTRNKNKFAV